MHPSDEVDDFRVKVTLAVLYVVLTLEPRALHLAYDGGVRRVAAVSEATQEVFFVRGDQGVPQIDGGRMRHESVVALHTLQDFQDNFRVGFRMQTYALDHLFIETVRLLHPLLHNVLLQLLPDRHAERHEALGLLAVLGVIATEGDQLLADQTSVRLLLLATLHVQHDALHLLTACRLTVGVAADAGVDKGLDVMLD